MVEGYNRSLTIFSPDGHLFQVDYAQEAVKKGSNVIGIKGKDCVVLGVEKKSVSALQDDRVLRKIFSINEDVILSYAGLSADARVLINYVRQEVESYRLSCDEKPSVTNVARMIADIKQDYTITGGRRPFGVSMIIAGFDFNGCPSIFKTEPMGTFFEYKAVAIGRSDKAVMEYLEANYNEESTKDEASVLKLAVKALTLVVQSGADIELSVVRMDKPPECVHRSVPVEEISEMVKKIQDEKEQELKQD
uniref:Proteasome subunit alpha type n=1 Tax=Ditylenchus dipsaci TaxID=166011 RepID=A0A915EAD9_9BILA